MNNIYFARRLLLIPFILGITSGIGAILKGNNPSMSFNMSLLALILLIATLGTDK
jgi:hypothetical protein